MSQEHFDVLAVGTGLSGIGAGYHLQEKCPGKSYVILEGRDCIGGTWDLFRDMYTLGYSFKPWTEPKAIADGPRILDYVRETSAQNGIDQKIRFNRNDWIRTASRSELMPSQSVRVR
jgi:monooxygenase